VGSIIIAQLELIDQYYHHLLPSDHTVAEINKKLPGMENCRFNVKIIIVNRWTVHFWKNRVLSLLSLFDSFLNPVEQYSVLTRIRYANSVWH